MAAVHGSIVGGMTLDHQAKMYGHHPHQIQLQQQQQHQVQQTNCVIVPGGYGSHQTSSSTSTASVIQGKRPLAPAPERNTVLMTASPNGQSSDLRCKRKIQFISSGPAGQPASVARRNARERNRVKQVNNGFAALRQHIPSNVLAAIGPLPGSGGSSPSGRGSNKKLSKVETLKLAVEYIRSLQQMLEDHEAEMATASSSKSGGSPVGSDHSLQDNRYYSSNPSEDTVMQQYGGNASPYPIILPTPPSSEASASPTPSHTSEGSPVFTNPVYHKQYYDPANYEPHSPEDDELLDAIFSWQQNS